MLLAYLALGLLLYAPVLGAFFLSDDFYYLSAIRRLPWPDVLTLQPGVFRPLHVVTWLVDFRLWGLDPVGYHLTNVVGHGLTAFFVFFLARHLLAPVLSDPERRWASVLAGLVFLAHPSHTEAVSWIIGRHDVFATLFVLVSWLAYAWFRERPRPAYLAGSLASFVAALLFKESVITFPLILVAYEGWRLLASRRSDSAPLGRLLAGPALFLGAVAAYVLLRRLASGDVVAGYELAFVRPALTAAFANLATTVFRSFFPYVPLQLLPHGPGIGLSGVAVLSASVVGAIGCLALIYRTWKRPTPTWLLVGFLTVALVLSAVPTVGGGPSIVDSEGERYAYLPSVFGSIVVGLAATSLTKTRAARSGLSAAVVLFMVAFLELSNQSWRTAGDLTRGILSSLQAEPGGEQVAVLLVPDNLNGAFIFRNGLQEAESVFGGGPGSRAGPAGWIFLQRGYEQVALDRVDAARYSLGIPGERGALRVVPGDPYPDLAVTLANPYRVDVAPRRPVRVAFFSGGTMTFADLAPG